MIKSSEDSHPNCAPGTNSLPEVCPVIEILPEHGGQEFTGFNLPEHPIQPITFVSTDNSFHPRKESIRVKLPLATTCALPIVVIILVWIIFNLRGKPEIPLLLPQEDTELQCFSPKLAPNLDFSSGKNAPKVKTTSVRSFPDLCKITNQTEQITLDPCNILVKDWSDFDWKCLPRIENANGLEIDILTLQRDWHFAHSTLNWLSSSISKLTVDAKQFNCSMDTIEDYANNYNQIVLSELVSLDVKNISACFVTKFVRVFDFPSIERVNIHGSDEKEAYHRTLITIFSKQSEKFASVTTLCTNKCR
ncbi:uncharacterized protein LOC118439460 [Folsomia candida]|nr:uncharacterized protein LOC118439460 [Folsomia candida]